MPFVANTPESLLGRSDSKDPRSTCRGITSSGRPCRRPVSRSISASSLAPHATPGLGDEGLYCWQHKEQASRSARSSPGPRARGAGRRSSLDTLVDRLGLVDLAGDATGRPHAQRPTGATRPRPKLQLCFCLTVPLEETHASCPPRPRPRPVQHAASASVPSLGKRQKQPARTSEPPASPSKSSQVSRKSNASLAARSKDLIPDSLDAATTSALMAELSRPYAEAEEAGYIYMFWLTPASGQVPPPVDAARSLLAPPSPVATRSRRPSDVISRFAGPSGGNGARSTMLLKIGRAANVQRRMNQWQRQCGYDIEMLRYYPYVPGASDASAAGPVPRRTPHCRRVERLIHIELAGMGLRASMATCKTCRRHHREWFSIQATREEIRRVDAVIRRWVECDESTAD